MPDSEAATVLLQRWLAWDKQPGSDHTAKPMEAACAAVATELGVATSYLRHRLGQLRSHRFERDEAIDIVYAQKGR